MAILVDFSQVVISACYAFSNELSVNNPDKNGAKNIVRHVILSQLKSYRKKFKEKYGDLIICVDTNGSKYWRKVYDPFYKANRKKEREQTSLDWDLVFNVMRDMLVDLKECFPYRVIGVEGAEGDDVVAVLAEYFAQGNEPDSTNPLFDSVQNVLVVSQDRDFVQLQKYENVEQWSPIKSAFICEKDPESYLREKVIRGDKGDGVPNVVNPIDSFVNPPEKTKKLTKKKFDSLFAGEFESEFEKERYEQNRTLIDFDCIPNEIKEKILNEYKSQTPNKNRAKIFNYLMSHGCSVLLREVEEF